MRKQRTAGEVPPSIMLAVLSFLVVPALPIPSASQQANSPGVQAPPQSGQHTRRVRNTRGESIKYRNTKYGFTFSLPKTWRGYSIIEGTWEGEDYGDPDGEGVVQRGPTITIRHPRWTEENPHQDIDVMVFTHAQWNSIQEGTLSVSAAAVGPGEIGRNRKYVFAEPPREIDENLDGYREVIDILNGDPLHTF